MAKLLKKVTLTRFQDGLAPVEENVIKESSLAVSVNGKKSFNITVCLPKQVKELVAGHLFAQGFIQCAADIKSIVIRDGAADVVLNTKKSTPPAAKKIKTKFTVTPEDVFNCVRAVLKSPVFEATEAVHSAGIFRYGKKPIAIAEDLGRHHALDKVIGAALLKGIPLDELLIASTGRMASEMVKKVCRAGIPIYASKAAVTDQGIALAKKHGVTLIGFVREAGSKMNTDMSTRTFKNSVMKIYSGAERVTL